MAVCALCLLLVPADLPAEGLIPSGGSSTEATSAPIDFESLDSRAAVRDVVSRLNDDTVRQLLIERLDAVAVQEMDSVEAETLSNAMHGALQRYLDAARESLTGVHTNSTLWSRVQSEFERGLQGAGTSWFFAMLAVSIAGGIVAERLVARLFRRRKQALWDEFGYTLVSVLRIIYSRLGIDLLGVLAFIVVTSVIWASQFGQGLVFQLGSSVCRVIAAVWVTLVLMRFLFSPNSKGVCFCQTSPERARAITISYALLAGLIVAVHNSVYILSIANREFGGMAAVGPYAFPVSVLMYLTVAGVILANRRTLTDVLLSNQERVKTHIGGEISEEAMRFARSWPTIAVVLVAFKYTFVQVVLTTTDLAEYSVPAVYMTFFVILLWPALDANVNLVVALGARAPTDQTEAAARAHTLMQRGLLRVGRVGLAGLVIYSMAMMWGLDFQGIAEAGLGAQAAGDVIEVLVTALVAYVLWEVVTIWSRRVLAAETASETGDDGGGDMGGVGLSRTATLVPIFEKTFKALILLVTIFLGLSELGINIAPLLAGSAVIGLAVGFGAQTLVKDIVSGLFFLADDAFRVAEYIEVGDTRGTVEKISLRSLRLRHHRGLVHTIPYGEIPKLTNYSRDWVIMKLRFRVPFDTDINAVKKIFKRIGQEMLEHPEIGSDFLQPFKSQGVAEMDDDAIVVRGKFTAKPGRQFMIRKEVYVRVQKAFEEAGIPFARKQVMVHIPGLENRPEALDESDVRRVAAAAADVGTRLDPAGATPSKT